MCRVRFPKSDIYNNDKEYLLKRLAFLKEKISSENLSINDIFELKAISSWLVREQNRDTKNIRLINITVKKYFQNTSIESICNEISNDKLEFIYQNEFWNMIEKFRFSKESIYSKEDVNSLLSVCTLKNIRFPLTKNKIVNDSKSLLKKIVKQDSRNIGLFINNEKIPKENIDFLTLKEKNDMIRDYIKKADLDCCSYLDLIKLSKISNDENKLLAIEKNDELISKLSLKKIEEKISLKLLSNVLEDSYPFVPIHDNNGNDTIYVNKNRLDKSISSKLSLINSIKTELRYMSSYGLIIFPYLNLIKIGFVDLIKNIKSSDDINMYNPSFKLMNSIPIYNFIFESFLEYISKNDFSLEKNLNWYLNDYLNQEYGINNITIIFPENHDEYRICDLFSSFHRLLKFIDKYAKNNKFNRKLLNLVSETPRFNELESVLPDKYINLSDPLLLKFQNFLYNDFFYGTKNDNSFLECLKNDSVEYCKLDRLDKNAIDYFISKKILILENKKVKIINPNLLPILIQNHDYATISKYSFNQEGRNFIDKLVSENKANYINKLLSPAEADFFEFIFSNKFSDGLGLRNKYMHGSDDPNVSKQRKSDYNFTLMMINLLIVKFNDDLKQRKILEEQNSTKKD